MVHHFFRLNYSQTTNSYLRLITNKFSSFIFHWMPLLLCWVLGAVLLCPKPRSGFIVICGCFSFGLTDSIHIQNNIAILLLTLLLCLQEKKVGMLCPRLTNSVLHSFASPPACRCSVIFFDWDSRATQNKPINNTRFATDHTHTHSHTRHSVCNRIGLVLRLYHKLIASHGPVAFKNYTCVCVCVMICAPDDTLLDGN